jgi:integrase
MKTSPIKVGQLTVRQHVRDGIPTGKWCVDLPAKLTGRRRRMLFDKQRKAVEVARDVNRRLSVAGVPAIAPAACPVTFGELASLWLEKQSLRVQTQKKRAASFEADQHRLKPLLCYLGNVSVSLLDENRMLAYQNHRLRMGRRPATINSEVGTLKHILKEGIKRGAIAAVPEIEYIPQRAKKVDIPTEREIVRLIEAAPVRLRVLLAFLAETGCRRGEALHLTWDAIDENGGFAVIEPRGEWTPKTASSNRRLPLSDGLLSVLLQVPRIGPYVFHGRDPNRPMADFKRSLASAVKAAGLMRNGKPMRITPHVLRKANATWLATRGVHPRVLQSLLGHSPGSRITDQHYVQSTDEALRQAAVTLPVWVPAPRMWQFLATGRKKV